MGSANPEHRVVWPGLHDQCASADDADAVIANKGVKKTAAASSKRQRCEGHSEEQKPKGEATRVIDEQVASQVMNAMESVSRPLLPVHQGGWLSCRSKVRYGGSRWCRWQTVVDYQRLFGDYSCRQSSLVVTVVLKDPQGVFGGLTAGRLPRRLVNSLCRSMKCRRQVRELMLFQ